METILALWKLFFFSKSQELCPKISGKLDKYPQEIAPNLLLLNFGLKIQPISDLKLKCLTEISYWLYHSL